MKRGEAERVLCALVLDDPVRVRKRHLVAITGS